MSKQTINIVNFCDLQGTSDTVRMTLTRMYKAKGEKTYAEWHKITSTDFSIGEIKTFSPTKENAVVVEEKTAEVSPKTKKKQL